MKDPICPKCGCHILQEINCIDIENRDNKVIFYYDGWCPHCDTVFEYKDIFTHHHYEVNKPPED